MDFGVGLVRNTSFGRKRVAVSNFGLGFEGFGDDLFPSSKRKCFQDSLFSEGKMAGIEDLPLEILVRIVCGVEHDDLRSLISVSKAMKEATLLAKQSHFAYSTPRKTLAFKSMEDFDALDEAEAPNAPKQSKIRRFRLGLSKLASISVNLFGSHTEMGWPR